MPQPNSAEEAITIILAIIVLVLVGGCVVVGRHLRNKYEGDPKDEKWRARYKQNRRNAGLDGSEYDDRS